MGTLRFCTGKYSFHRASEPEITTLSFQFCAMAYELLREGAQLYFGGNEITPGKALLG